MIALDTNVLVRFLVEDDAAQSERARQLMLRALDSGSRLFVPDGVVCETVSVLTRSYRVPRADVFATLRKILAARQLAFAAPERLLRALDAYAVGRGDFADYLIREEARDAGCPAVCTFDSALLAEPGFAAP